MNLTLMAVSFVLLLSATTGGATPIKPDIRKMLAHPTPSSTQFAPSRAGWNGPETPARMDASESTYSQIGPAGTAQQIHQAVYAAFVPDYRALGAIVLIILLLRRMTTHRRTPRATISANGVSGISFAQAAPAAEGSSKRAA